MTLLLLRLTRRHIQRHLLQSMLLVVGIALGVAVGVAIDLASTSANRAFNLSVDSITGPTTHQIRGPANTLSAEVYSDIQADLGTARSAPIVEDFVRALSLQDRNLRLLGVNPAAEAAFRDNLLPDQTAINVETQIDLPAFLTQPDTVLISRDMAQRYELGLGSEIVLRTRSEAETSVTVVGFLSATDQLSREAFSDLIVANLANAQSLTGMQGRLTRIDLILPDGYDQDRLISDLPPGATLVEVETSRQALSQMTDAFKFNLQALSLMALLVGVFLIYNTVTFSVVQRRPVMGILRSLGTTQRQIFLLILTEALVLGGLGAVCGLGLGIVLAQGAVQLVSQTINDLYFRVNVEDVTIQASSLIKGGVIGVTASVLAAVIPSLEATRTPPAGVMRRSTVEQGTRRIIPFISAFAVIVAGAGVGLLQFDTNDLIISFAALFLILVGCALLTPLAMIGFMRLSLPVSGLVIGVPGRMAPRAIVRSLSRTSVAVAALTLAVSVIVGVSIMIRSFRDTLTTWLNSTLSADIYISPFGSDTSAIDVDIDAGIVTSLAILDGVEQVATVRQVEVVAPDYPALPPVSLAVVDTEITDGRREFVWNNAPNNDYWRAMQSGAIIVSEPFAFRRDISPDNNVLTLLTEQGPVDFEVIGVFYDYSTDQGTVLIYRAIYRNYYDDPDLSAIALLLAPDVRVDTVLNTLKTETLVGTGLQAQSNRSLRQAVLDIFDRTFSITIALRLLATIVAFIGILSTLMSLQLENMRQYGIMRANGLTPHQLRIFTFVQTGLMGTVAGIMALPIGIVLALVLIYVINVRSFGWSMDMTLDATEFFQAFAVALVAALLAGLYPAYRLSHLIPAAALRSE